MNIRQRGCGKAQAKDGSAHAVFRWRAVSDPRGGSLHLRQLWRGGAHGARQRENRDAAPRRNLAQEGLKVDAGRDGVGGSCETLLVLCPYRGSFWRAGRAWTPQASRPRTETVDAVRLATDHTSPPFQGPAMGTPCSRERPISKHHRTKSGSDTTRAPQVASALLHHNASWRPGYACGPSPC